MRKALLDRSRVLLRRYSVGTLRCWVYFFLVIFVAIPSNAGCRAPKQEMQAKIARYAAAKFHVDPGLVHVSSLDRAAGSCFWAVHLSDSSNKVLTLYLSPDFRFLAPDLYDLNEDPLNEERARLQKLSSQLLAKKSPQMGHQGSSITIVVFSDFQCPYCRNLNDGFLGLRSKGELQDVRIVFKNYPLPFHDWAYTAALVGECVLHRDQGSFWEYQDLIFSSQNHLRKEDLMAMGSKFLPSSEGAQVSLQECVSDTATATEIEKDIQLGRDIGIKATPTFFVNGQRFEGSKSTSQLEAILSDARRALSLSSK